MTINQAIDKLTEGEELNLEQQDLLLTLKKFKTALGGNIKIENTINVNNIIEFGNKEGR